MESIRKHYRERVQNLLNMYGNKEQVIEKSITQDEFNRRYSAGYEVYTVKGFDAYLKDLTKAHEEDKDLLEKAINDFKQQLPTFEKIMVKDIGEVFVRPVTEKEEVIEKGEVEEEQKETTEEVSE